MRSTARTGAELAIADLAHKIREMFGFTGKIVWDATRPDGQPRRRLDTTRARDLLGWSAQIPLDEGLRRTIDWWQAKQSGTDRTR